jgi:hypothetical protein
MSAPTGGQFVTVMPRTRKEDRVFREQLRAGLGPRWRTILRVENRRQIGAPRISMLAGIIRERLSGVKV